MIKPWEVMMEVMCLQCHPFFDEQLTISATLQGGSIGAEAHSRRNRAAFPSAFARAVVAGAPEVWKPSRAHPAHTGRDRNGARKGISRRCGCSVGSVAHHADGISLHIPAGLTIH